jgi:hypothetical protein
MGDAWHLLKTQGAANIRLSRDLLPYAVRGLSTELGDVTLIARFAADPAPASVDATVDGGDVAINFLDSWAAHLADVPDLAFDTPFALGLDAAHLGTLTDLCLVLKVEPA